MAVAENKTYLTEEEIKQNKKTLAKFVKLYKFGNADLKTFIEHYGKYIRVINDTPENKDEPEE